MIFVFLDFVLKYKDGPSWHKRFVECPDVDTAREVFLRFNEWGNVRWANSEEHGRLHGECFEKEGDEPMKWLGIFEEDGNLLPPKDCCYSGQTATIQDAIDHHNRGFFVSADQMLRKYETTTVDGDLKKCPHCGGELNAQET